MKAKELIQELLKNPEAEVILLNVADDTYGTYNFESKDIDLVDLVDDNDDLIEEQALAIMFEAFPK
jgi:Fe-S cluster assembly iron-binding protein IscA